MIADMNRTQVFSYGGGVQSVAVCALIIQGRLPKPDYIVISDTGYEKGTTWEYMDNVTSPALAKVGLKIDRIKRTEYSKYDVVSTSNTGRYDVLPPVYIRRTGLVSKLPGHCSGEWKRNSIRRWLREQGVRACDLWLGISLDEKKRVRESTVQWVRNVYPLISAATPNFKGAELNLTRADCLSVVHDMGWPTPPRSSCYICPNMTNAEWKDIPAHEIQKAMEVEATLQVAIRKDVIGIYLHRSGLPIEQACTQGSNAVDTIACPDLAECNSGYCFV
jgi:hypothetical protein